MFSDEFPVFKIKMRKSDHTFESFIWKRQRKIKKFSSNFWRAYKYIQLREYLWNSASCYRQRFALHVCVENANQKENFQEFSLVFVFKRGTCDKNKDVDKMKYDQKYWNISCENYPSYSENIFEIYKYIECYN